MRSIRLLSLSILLFLVVAGYLQGDPASLAGGSVKIPLFLFNLIVMLEVFFHYKVSRIMPELTVDKNNSPSVYKSFTLQAISPFVTEHSSEGIIGKLIKNPTIKLFMQKANIAHEDLPYVKIDKAILAKGAFDQAVIFKGKFVTALDVFIAYLLFIEKDKKLLFGKKLKTEDLKNISDWIRNKYPEEEKPKNIRVNILGGGIGEDLISGWTYETKKYTSKFTSTVLKYKPSIRGREIEFNNIIEGLTKFENNNVLIVGDIGIGKENMVRALAYYSFVGEISTNLNYKRLLELLVGQLLAGATTRSDLEERLQEIIAEISHATDVIIYMPDFQNILGGSSFGLDLSGALLPFLKSGQLPVIATMTTEAYKSFMQKNPLIEAFTVIELKEPKKDTAIQMVLDESSKIEKKYDVILSHLSIVTAIELADRFLQDQVLPGSAISLLETVANSVSLSADSPYFDKIHKKMVLDDHVVKQVEQVSHVPIGTPSNKEAEDLLHLEERLHSRIIEQNEAITAISEALRRVRSGMTRSEKPVSFLFLGPTGVGKTETAKALADFYYGGEKNMIRLDMSEYTGEDGPKRLLGAAPGQGTERGELTDKIHDNPASLVLLDEFEKANPQIHNLFLQVFDDGRLTDNKGVTVSFENAIIIATSNAGSEFIREEVGKGVKVDKKFQQALLEHLQTKNIFKPELLNRFDAIVTFKPLEEKQVEQVVKLFLDSLTKTLLGQDIKLVVDQAVIEKIMSEGIDVEFGARPLKRYIQDNLEDMIAKKKLTKELDRGKTATFSVDTTGALQLIVSG